MTRNSRCEARRPQILLPIAAVEGAVLNGFSQMGDSEVFGAFQVGDGARHFEDAVMGARGETLLLHGAFEKALGIGAEFAMGSNLAGCHLRVGVDFFAGLTEALPLALAGCHYAVAYLGRALGGCPTAKLFVLHCRNFDVDVYTVEKRTGDFGD